MKEDKYLLDINKAVTLNWIIIDILMALGVSPIISQGGLGKLYTTCFFLIIFGCPVVYLFIRRTKNYELIKYVKVVSCMLTYIIGLIGYSHFIVFTYGIPIIIIMFLYQDIKLSAILSAVMIAVNVVAVAFLNKGTQPSEAATIQIIVMILSCVLSIVVTRIVKSYTENKINDMKETLDISNKIRNQLSDTKDNVAKSISEIFNKTQANRKDSDEISHSIGQVGDVLNTLAQSLEGQNSSMTTIQGRLDEIELSINSISRESKDSNTLVLENCEDIQGLNLRATSISEISDSVDKNMEELKEQVNAVKELTNIIANISSQTNLLSLNASIEAARAGEAGKGFAVVAGEIGTLSNNTQSALIKINETLVELDKKTNSVKDSLNLLSTEVGNQSMSIENINNRTNMVKDNSISITYNAGKIEGEIENIIVDYKHVSDEINNISAIAEEINASVEEIGDSSNKMSELSKDIVRDTDDVKTAISVEIA